MKVLIELNKRFGRGYQGRLIMGPLDSVIDSEPFTLYEVTSGMQMAVDEINKEHGTSYQIHEVMSITDEALEVNSKYDLASAMLMRDIKQGKTENIIPAKAEVAEAIVDGEREILLSGSGVILLSFCTWVDERNHKAKEVLRRYCELLAMKGYGKRASAILRELISLDKEAGTAWLRNAFEKYTLDSNEIIQYVMR